MRRQAAFLVIFACLALTGFLMGCKKAGQSGAPDVNLSAQLEGLKNPDKDTRVNAVVALASLKEGAVSAVPQLIEALKDPEADVRRLAAYALMEIGPGAKAALPELNNLMQDPDRSVVTQVINTIRVIQPGSLPGLDMRQVMGTQ